ncbi:MAG TPA: hypothetical protein VD770_02590, partial [Coxiellaceae bacterium]|nr:hypothetical protein [Coxiellaceae bacterium]
MSRFFGGSTPVAPEVRASVTTPITDGSAPVARAIRTQVTTPISSSEDSGALSEDDNRQAWPPVIAGDASKSDEELWRLDAGNNRPTVSVIPVFEPIRLLGPSAAERVEGEIERYSANPHGSEQYLLKLKRVNRVTEELGSTTQLLVDVSEDALMCYVLRDSAAPPDLRVLPTVVLTDTMH